MEKVSEIPNKWLDGVFEIDLAEIQKTNLVIMKGKIASFCIWRQQQNIVEIQNGQNYQ